MYMSYYCEIGIYIINARKRVKRTDEIHNMRAPLQNQLSESSVKKKINLPTDLAPPVLRNMDPHTKSDLVDIVLKMEKICFKEDGDPDIIANNLRSSIMADDIITLKEGTQVMCIANIDQETEGAQIVNGSQGIVTGFLNDLPIVRFRNGTERVIGRHAWKPEGLETVSVTQLPLIYAWAITIHKAQGITLEIAEIDVGSHIFECGQTYVALSRVKSLSGLYLSSFNYSRIKVNSKVKRFYENN